TIGDATASLQYGVNTVTFNGANGTGFDFALAKASDVWLYSNQITDNAAGATGMLFDAIAAGSRVQIEGNTINLLSTSAVVDRGIIFTTVGDTITLLGNTSNTVVGATTNASIPAGKSTGFIIINGASFP